MEIKRGDVTVFVLSYVNAKDEEGRFVEDSLSNYERGGRRLKIKPKNS